ncbi:MAG: hypothetical protein AT707_04830 [Pyrobaculum sp. JCHS_4]|jgi:hypothetical protein|nr:MAG: hypothetical protein AT707_04830 [Pyrobaculum sp. JCHS_4]
MDRNIEIKERLELALRPAEKPTLEEVLEQVSTHGVLRGPVDWVFPAWMLYVEYATQKIIETFQLSEEEKKQLFHFRDALTRLLREAWAQAKERLTALYKAVAEGMYRVEGNKLYAPDGTWMHIGKTMIVLIRDVSASARFPDVLKLPRERLELLQLGWRASDEGEVGNRSYMATTQPWQVFAWTATRYGELYIRVASANLTREGVSVSVHLRANSWRQKWGKAEAIDLVANHLRRGEWTPLLTMWLGDGVADRKKVLHSKYQLVIKAKEPWRLGISVGTRRAFVARGKEAFERLRGSAGPYAELLDLLKAHKWVDVKLATDDGFRAAYKLKTRKRSIDILRETYKHNNGEIPTQQFPHAEELRRGAVVVVGVVMYLRLVSGTGGSLLADHYTSDVRKALAVAERLESAGLRPNIVRSGPKYVVYIATADLLRMAEKDDTVRRAVALYLTEKVKNGTPRQRELAEKILKRHPLFYLFVHLAAF